MTIVLEGTLGIGSCIVVTFQDPKGKVAKALCLVTNRLIVMLGDIEDEVFEPNKGILVVFWDVYWMWPMEEEKM